MLNSIITFLKEWYQGNLDLDAKMMAKEDEKSNIKKDRKRTRKNRIHYIGSVENTERRFTRFSYLFFSVIFCLILSSVLIITVNYLPLFADENAPTANEVYEHYVGEGRNETGAINTVAGMILDYRAFDTLGAAPVRCEMSRYSPS